VALDVSWVSALQITREDSRTQAVSGIVGPTNSFFLIVEGEPYTPTDEKNKNGYFIQPTVIVNATDSMRIAREEA
jgi:hypothetical protein